MRPTQAIQSIKQPLLGGRYRLLGLVNTGGMGRVYRAFDRLTGETVALKRVLAPFGHAFVDPAVRLALTHEFQALAALRHPNIVSVRDYGFDRDQQPYFTMDLLVAARPVVADAPFLSVAQKLQRLAGVLHALAYLHRQRIVHGDLKPGNVLVSEGVVKVLDFGLAGVIGQTQLAPGTVAYTAPEVLRGAAATPAADLFALGILAFELLAGWHPFGAHPHEAVEAILAREPAWDYLDLDPPLLAVLQRLLAKEPAERFADAEAVVAAFSAASGEALPIETAATRESFLQAAPLIGRTTELTQLQTALTRAQMGHGSAWLVRGESGVGKSRLLSELRTQALVQGMIPLRGQASSTGGGAYHLWREVLRRVVLLTEVTDAEAAILHPLIPDLADLLERPVAVAPVLEAKAAQARLWTAIRTLLARVAHQQPLLCLLEDLHWADANSRELLGWLQRTLLSAANHTPLLIVASYRHGEAPTLPDQLPAMELLALQRLQPADIRELSAAMLGAAGRQPPLVAFLQRETEGNAFFVVEVLRALAEEAGELRQVGRMTLPGRVLAGGVQQVLARRLGRIPAEAQPLLALAATAGRRLDLAVLGALAGSVELDGWLTLCANALVLEAQDGRWQFHHDKLREAVVERLSTATRRTLHHQVGVTIEAVHAGQLAPFYADLAYHFGQADDLPRERTYLKLAGEAAQAAFANAAAITAYSRLVTLTDEPQEQIEALLKLGAVLKFTGRWPEAEARFRQALAQASASASPLAEARTFQALGNLERYRSDFPVALAWLWQAHDCYTRLAERTGLCEVLSEIGNVGYQQGEYAEAKLHLLASLALARELEQPAMIALALHCLGNVAFDQGDYVATKTFYEESLAIRRQIGDKVGLASTLNNLGILASYQADFAATHHYYEESLALRYETGDRANVAVSLNNLGIVAKEQGDFARAQTLYEESVAIHRELGNRQGMAYARNNLAALAFAQGDYGAAKALYTENLAEREAINDKWGVASTLSSLGDVALVQGEVTVAQDSYRKSLRYLRTIGDKQKIAYGLVGMAAVALAVAAGHAGDGATESLLRAVRLSAAVQHLTTDHKLVLELEVLARHHHTVQQTAAQLGQTDFAAAWATGSTLTVDAALDEALSSLI